MIKLSDDQLIMAATHLKLFRIPCINNQHSLQATRIISTYNFIVMCFTIMHNNEQLYPSLDVRDIPSEILTQLLSIDANLLPTMEK